MDEWAKEAPEKPALLWCNDEDPDKLFTFADMSRLSAQAANVLASLGIQKGDAVLLMLKQRPEVWITMLALQKLGAVVIPATYQLTTKDIVYRCNAANVKALITVDDPGMIDYIDQSRPNLQTVAHFLCVGDHIPNGYLDYRALIAQAKAEFPRPTGAGATKNADTMLIYFSSGTTGMPKMIRHDYTYPLGHITTAKYWQRVEDGGLHLTVSDSGWAKFGWGKIYGQWICGAVIVAYDTEKFNAHNMLEMMQRLRLTTFCAPPTVFRFLIKEDISGYDLSSIQHCSIAGEPLNPEVYHAFYKLTGLHLTEGFGQSETSVIIANYDWFPVKPGSTGKPSPLYDIDIVDAEGNSCEDGIVGSIVVKNISDETRPVGLFREYYNDEEANMRAFGDGWYNTGDMAWRDADGYFWFVGRNDDVIKCSGYRIGPFEVENALMTHPSVLECAVTAAPDPVRGQVVKATIVLARGFAASEALKREIQNHVKKVTAPYKYPRIVDFVKELPKTVSGKIRRVEIRQADNEK